MNDEARRRLVEAITKTWADQGRIVQGGWLAMVACCGLDNVPEVQRHEMRKAYFLGAQHLFASILTVLEPGAEATEADTHKLELIDKELRAFLEEYKKELS